MAADTKPEAPPTLGTRLKTVRAALAAAEKTRKWYRLAVLSINEAGVKAPFFGVSISIPSVDGRPSRAFTFAESVEAVIPDPRDPEFKTKRVTKEGAADRLTEGEAALLRDRIGDYVVRWQSRDGCRALVIDTKADRFALDAGTDEPIESWLLVDGPLAEKP
jgi:hypothetical protein